MSKSNHARKFNASQMPRVNQAWAARVLNMDENPDYNNGPDLIDEDKFVEVKFTLSNPRKKNRKRNYSKSWTVLEPQTKYQRAQKKKGFWGLGLYELDRNVDDIETDNLEELESMVLSRKLYIITWKWIYRFPLHHTSGRTEKSEWDRYLRYPKQNRIPKTTLAYPVEKGLVCLTQGVPEGMFNIHYPPSATFLNHVLPVCEWKTMKIS
jgi:hypothetical protein